MKSVRRPADGSLTVVVVSETDRRDVRLEKQLRALVMLGHEVHLVAPGGAGTFVAVPVKADDGPDEVYGMRIPAGESPGATSESPTYRWVPAGVRRLGASVLNAANGARRRRDRRRRIRRVAGLLPALKPDLLMLHRDYVAAELLGRRLVDAPAVVDLHEIPRVLHGERFAPTAQVTLRRRRERRRLLEGLRRAHVVTSEELISKHLTEEFDLPTVELPSVMLGSFGDPQAGSQNGDVASLRSRLGLTDEHRLVVYLGFYRPIRGVERLIEALRHLPDHYHLALVVGWTGRELRATLADHPEGHRIHLLDLVAQDELIPFLRGSDLGVYVPDDPSTPHEHLCMPTKLYEFHAAEVPVLVAADPGLNEFAARYGGSVVVPRPVDPRTLADRIADTVEGRLVPAPRYPTPDLRAVMGDVIATAFGRT